MPLYYLVYVSAAQNENPSIADIESILESSVRNNDIRGITGMLLLAQGSFMQLLEGEQAAVQDTYARIQLDWRHKDLIIVMEGPTVLRTFPGWSMGYAAITGNLADMAPRYRAVLHKGFSAASLQARPGLALDLLKHYSQNNRLR